MGRFLPHSPLLQHLWVLLMVVSVLRTNSLRLLPPPSTSSSRCC